MGALPCAPHVRSTSLLAPLTSPALSSSPSAVTAEDSKPSGSRTERTSWRSKRYADSSVPSSPSMSSRHLSSAVPLAPSLTSTRSSASSSHMETNPPPLGMGTPSHRRPPPDRSAPPSPNSASPSASTTWSNTASQSSFVADVSPGLPK